MLSEDELAIYRTLTKGHKTVLLYMSPGIIINDLPDEQLLLYNDVMYLYEQGIIEEIKTPAGTIYGYGLSFSGKKLFEFHRSVEKFLE